MGHFYPFLISLQKIVVKSHTNNQTPDEPTAPALFCLKASLLLISLGQQPGYSPCVFFLQQQKPVSALFSTVVVKVKVEANLALSVVESPARGEVPHRGGRERLHKTALDPGWLWQPGQCSVQLRGYHCRVETTKATLPDRWISF